MGVAMEAERGSVSASALRRRGSTSWARPMRVAFPEPGAALLLVALACALPRAGLWLPLRGVGAPLTPTTGVKATDHLGAAPVNESKQRIDSLTGSAPPAPLNRKAINIESFVVESQFCHHAPFEYEYEYRCTEYEYDLPDERPGSRGWLRTRTQHRGTRTRTRLPPQPWSWSVFVGSIE